jgi:hypothetical protein
MQMFAFMYAYMTHKNGIFFIRELGVARDYCLSGEGTVNAMLITEEGEGPPCMRAINTQTDVVVLELKAKVLKLPIHGNLLLSK